MIDLAVLTGMRPGELVSLTGGMINRIGDVWVAVLDDHKTVHQGKACILVFGPKSQAILSRYITLDPTRRLFPLKRATFSNRLKRACVELGISKFTAHCLRHTAATDIRESHGLDAVQAMHGPHRWTCRTITLTSRWRRRRPWLETAVENRRFSGSITGHTDRLISDKRDILNSFSRCFSTQDFGNQEADTVAKIDSHETSMAFHLWATCLSEFLFWAREPDPETTSRDGWREAFKNDIRDKGNRARDAAPDDVTRNQFSRSRSLTADLVRMMHDAPELNCTSCRNWSQPGQRIVNQLGDLQLQVAKLSEWRTFRATHD